MPQMHQQVTGHGDIAQGHDHDEPQDTFCQRLFAPGNPEPEEEEAAVGIDQSGPEPGDGPLWRVALTMSWFSEALMVTYSIKTRTRQQNPVRKVFMSASFQQVTLQLVTIGSCPSQMPK